MSHEDYPNASVLDRRVRLHEECSTNSYGWHRWVMDHIYPHLRGRVLEVGAGPAYLWAENAERIPPGFQLTLSDRSPGMLTDARSRLKPPSESQTWLNCDVMDLPFPECCFDTVIANHVLFLLEDPALAVEQLVRCLSPVGVLCATTNHRDHLLDLIELFVGLSEEHFGHLKASEIGQRRERFNFVTGADLLMPHFTDVQLITYADGLEIDHADILEPWMVYWAEPAMESDDLRRMLKKVNEKIGVEGAIHIRKNSGMFIARKGEI